MAGLLKGVDAGRVVGLAGLDASQPFCPACVQSFPEGEIQEGACPQCGYEAPDLGRLPSIEEMIAEEAVQTEAKSNHVRLGRIFELCSQELARVRRQRDELMVAAKRLNEVAASAGGQDDEQLACALNRVSRRVREIEQESQSG